MEIVKRFKSYIKNILETDMKTVTAAELLILDAEQFRKEYYKWQEYCMEGDDMD